MKNIIIGGIIIFAVILLSPQIVQGQGTVTYLSNLAQASAGSLAVGSNSWVAAPFSTGTNASGYTLDSIQLAMTDASGNPSEFTAYLYSASGGAGPGLIPFRNLDTFSCSLSPTTGGTFTYTTVSNITLFANTTYFILLVGGTAVADGAYEWSYTSASSFNSSEGWHILIGGANNGVSTFSDVNSGWTVISGDYAQFAINATPIPEPGVLGLIGLGGFAFLWHRRKAKAA